MKTNTNTLPLTSIGGFARQGDTLLRRISTIPTTFKQTHTPFPTLALGEVSGHHHSFRDGGAVAFANDEKAPLAEAIRVTADRAVLTHEEHSPITFPQGDYESLKQVEDQDGEFAQVRD